MAKIPLAKPDDPIVQLLRRICGKKTVFHCVGCSTGMDGHLAIDSSSFDKCFIDKTGEEDSLQTFHYGLTKNKKFAYDKLSKLLLVRRASMVPICQHNGMACFKNLHEDIAVKNPTEYTIPEKEYLMAYWHETSYAVTTGGSSNSSVIQKESDKRRKITIA